MELHEYPRPTNDTGIGLIWSPGASQLPPASLHDFWIPELVRMGVKWVRLTTQRKAAPILEALLAAQIMPVVALDYPLHHARLGERQLAEIRGLIGLGVRYFELSVAPTRNRGWSAAPQEGHQDRISRTGADAEAILALGGLPGLPAITHPAQPLILGDLLASGYGSLAKAGLWQAVAIPFLNRPLTYPQDQANQAGMAVTQEFYNAILQEGIAAPTGRLASFHPWQGLSLAEVNRLRREVLLARQNGQNSEEDSLLAWRSYEQVSQAVRDLLARPLPLIVTGGGWQLGNGEDPRYPAITPLLHMAHTLEACRVMMGTSHRQPPAPGELLAACLGTLASQALQSDQSGDEAQVWYGLGAEPDVLPVVLALRAEPKRARAHRQAATLSPALAEGEGEIPADPLGSPLGGGAVGRSILAGKVRGGAGAMVRLVEAGGTGYTTVARQDGGFRFINLPAGRYCAWVLSPPGSRRDGLILDGENQEEVILSADGWGYELSYQEEERTGTILRIQVAASVRTADAGTLAARLRRPDERGGRVVALARRADGAATCEIGPLASGSYRVEMLGVLDSSGETVPLGATLLLRRGVAELLFVYNPDAAVHWYRFSDIKGRVIHGNGEEIRLVSEEGQVWNAQIGHGQSRRRAISAPASVPSPVAPPVDPPANSPADPPADSPAKQTDAYAFTDLAPGIYHLTVTGHGEHATANRIFLDGRNQVEINFRLPQAESLSLLSAVGGRGVGAIAGTAPGLAQGQLWLQDSQGTRYPLAINRNEQFYQANLPEETYRLSGGGHLLTGLDILPGQVLELSLPPYRELWRWFLAPQPAAPGQAGDEETGQLTVTILGRQGAAVQVRSRHHGDRVGVTGAEGGDPFQAHFPALAPGGYWVQVDELDMRLSVDIEVGQSYDLQFWRQGGVAGVHQRHYRALA
jgi:hypothetical protein